MVLCQLVGGLCLGTIGVNPSVQLHAAFMALLNHPLQRVPEGSGCKSLLCCQESAPRFDAALVECITFRANLKEDGIHAVFLQFVELIGQRALHLIAPHACPLSVNSLYPGTYELTFFSLCHH